MKNLTIDNYIQIGLLIITFVSVFSPVITNILNNIHDTKIKKMEIDSKVKQEILTNFSKTVNYLHGYDSIGIEFYKCLNLLNIYFDVDNEYIFKIMENSYSNEIEFLKDVTILMQKLSMQIKDK